MPHKILIHFGLIAVLTLALTGCMAQSRIQAKYMTRDDTCRNEAQLKAAESQKHDILDVTNDTPQPDTGYVLANAFSECMNRNGWKVAVPKAPPSKIPPASAATTQSTTVTTTTTITPATGTATTATPVVTTAAVPSATTASVAASPILGPGVQPSPAPAFSKPPAVKVQGTSNASTYQPARPENASAPNYGQGAGRNF